MSAAPEGSDDRPPVTVPPSGAAAPFLSHRTQLLLSGTDPHAQSRTAPPFARLRPTVIDRPVIRPTVWEIETSVGYPPTDPYVRRYWIPVVGPGAIADLLRLATAATRRRPLLRPLHLATLARAGLVTAADGSVAVRLVIPPVPEHLRTRLPARLRREHPGVPP